MKHWFSRGPAKGIRDLAGKVVVVTGAASGIGRCLALGLREKGCHLALVDIDAAGLKQLKAEIGHPDGTSFRLTTHVADVSNRARMRELPAEVAAAHGVIHVLINNAGVSYEGAFQHMPLEDWDHVMGVNLWGVIHGCYFFMPYLAKADRAHIVNMSSLLGIVAMGGQSAYSATKYAVRGLSETLWEELRPTSVGLTVVHPGAVRTPILKHARGDDPELLKRLDAFYDRKALPPEQAAAAIIRAIERGTPRLLIAPETRFADWIKRLMPVRGHRLVGDIFITMLGEDGMRARRLAQWRETMIEHDKRPR